MDSLNYFVEELKKCREDDDIHCVKDRQLYALENAQVFLYNRIMCMSYCWENFSDVCLSLYVNVLIDILQEYPQTSILSSYDYNKPEEDVPFHIYMLRIQVDNIYDIIEYLEKKKNIVVSDKIKELKNILKSKKWGKNEKARRLTH